MSAGGVRLPSLRRNLSWTLVGNVIFAAGQWAILIVIAKIGTAEMVGQFSLALAITAPILLVANLNLRIVQATDAQRKYRFGDYATLRGVCLLLATLVIALIGLIGYRGEMFWLLAAVTAAKVCDSVSDLIYGFLQQREWMDRIAISRILQALLQLGALTAALYWTRDLMWGSVAMAAAALLVILTYNLPSIGLALTCAGEYDAATLLRWKPQTMRSLFLLALPLGLSGAVDSLNANMPRYFLEGHAGREALGYFSAIVYIMMTGGIVQSALIAAGSARLSRYYFDNRAAYRRLVGKLLLLAIAAGLAGILMAAVAGRPLLTLVYSPAYAQYTNLFVWVMVAAAFWHLSGVLNCAVNAANRYHIELRVMLAGLAATTLGCLLLIPRVGLLGAGYAVCLGMAMRALLFAMVYRGLADGGA